MDALPLLCLLGVFCSLGLAIDKAVPPEDLDGSGDDEDFSGSGDDGLFVDVDSKDVAVFSTSVSTLVPTVEGSTAAQEPEILDKEETKLEDATVSTETTKTHNPLIEDLFAVDAGDKEAITQEATTSPLQQTSTAEILEEIDTRKHHHHHHHPHHPTTTSSTTLPSESDRPDDDTIDVPPEVDKPLDLPVNATAGTPDEESELHHVLQELTTPFEDLAKHGVLHEDTTSGSTSTYAATEEANVDPLDADKLPALDSLVTTTVAEHAHKDHHHNHHHPHHHPTTTSSFAESDVQEEVTTRPSDTIELGEGDVKHGEPTTTVAGDEHPPHHHHHTHHHKTTPSTTESTEPDMIELGEGDVKEGEPTTTVAGDEHPPHHHHHTHHHKTTPSTTESTEPDMIELGEGDVKEGEPTTTVAEDGHPHHHHHTHHHKTTPSTTESTEPEQPHEVHTHEPKGRRVHVPDVRSTTAVPVINEEHVPEDAEKDAFTSSTVHYNVSGNPFDEIDDTLDSKEEGPSGVADQDMFFEATVPVLKKVVIITPDTPIPDEGTSDASQGIMERKELLAGIIAGGVAGLVFAACLVAFVLYRMKKKDEGSYSLEEPKQSNGGYQKPREQREFYA